MKRKPKCTELSLDKNTVGFRIRKFRRLKNLSSDELGILIETTGSNVLMWERNVRLPKLETRLRIAKSLNIDPILLFPELESTFSLSPTKELSDYSTLDLIHELERRCIDGRRKTV